MSRICFVIIGKCLARTAPQKARGQEYNRADKFEYAGYRNSD